MYKSEFILFASFIALLMKYSAKDLSATFACVESIKACTFFVGPAFPAMAGLRMQQINRGKISRSFTCKLVEMN